ncbi:unnamed protein product [Kuraishia capsulata CBS 1993]|uniref:RRM domain-containing protein n=1 Tax=Kuraishia capsulata CBS 1993 TaxID=1382522 RepID=W6MLC4_9ASCO|nr:uncharacterized protein KUCA_T00003277001 [Kuraishia capsulata CBS 1993]CDK27299.1 unnamed protein product [Kuraishia capsulata CBS 1993]
MEKDSIEQQVQGKRPSELSQELQDLLSYDKTTGRWILELAEKNVYLVFSQNLLRWIPEEEDAANAKSATDVPDATAEFHRLKKEELLRQKLEKQKQKEQSKRERKNTAVYVTGLPLNIGAEELRGAFSKYGVIAEDLKTGEKKVKIYKDANGKVKGDALIVYAREESVAMAIEFLDGTSIGADSGKIHVSAADFSHKAADEPKLDTKPLGFKEKAQLKRKIEKLKNKVEGWEDDDEIAERKRAKAAKFDKVVVLKHCFTQEELKEDATAILDIKEDIREGCEQIGEVTNVVLYDLEPEGIVSVRFASSVAADICIKKMNGRFFSGQKLEAFKPDGLLRYKKSGKDDDNEAERLKNFGEWLDKE